MSKKHQVQIHLDNPYAYWYSTQLYERDYSLSMRGYAFIDEAYYSGETLVRYVSDHLERIPPEEHISVLKDLIPQLNGGWALVYETSGIVLAAVDRLRSIPLFYAIENGKVFLSDDARKVLKCLDSAKMDDICAAEFLVAGYVTGKDTLYKGLYQIQPGEILEVKIPENAFPQISTHRYYRFIFGNYFEANEQELEEELPKLWHRIFSRYAIALKGKTPVIPLSGGLDSRLIAAMLKKYGVKNVICFSYGRYGNDEAEASRAIANALGYEWLFYPYDESSWYKWFREKQMMSYIDYGSNYSSVAHLQDWPSTREILNDISDDVVFIPGHTGDSLTGGHIAKELFSAKENTTYNQLVPEAVLTHHYALWPWRNVCPELQDVFVKRIRELLPEFSDSDKSQAIGAYETWGVENRQALYIINSVRVYEFFGCQWMLPWWDYELMDFFSRVKLDLRYQKKLYRNTLLHNIFVDDLSELTEIPVVGLGLLSQNSNDQKTKYQSLRSFVYRGLKKITPNFVKQAFRKYQRCRNTNPLALYGRYDDAQIGTRLIHFLGSLDVMSGSVKNILSPNLNKVIRKCHTGGVNAAYYMKLWLLE